MLTSGDVLVPSSTDMIDLVKRFDAYSCILYIRTKCSGPGYLVEYIYLLADGTLYISSYDLSTCGFCII